MSYTENIARQNNQSNHLLYNQNNTFDQDISTADRNTTKHKLILKTPCNQLMV